MHQLLTSTLTEALYLALALALPALGVGFLVALVISALQGFTQWTDPSLSAIPRSLAVLLSLTLSGAWMAGQLAAYAGKLLRALPELVR